jgi:hypothetical protein
MNGGNGQVDISFTTPELSTWAMMLVGFAGIGYVGWLRMASGAARGQGRRERLSAG